MECQAAKEHLQDVADILGLLDYVPAATATFIKKVARCDFSHFNLKGLDTGIHTFGTTHNSPQSCTKLQQVLSVYNNLRKGTGASLLDFQVLLDTEKIGILYSKAEVTYCFKSFGILLHSLLGSLHPLVEAWDSSVSMWTGCKDLLSESLGMCQYVLLLLRWLQIRFWT